MCLRNGLSPEIVTASFATAFVSGLSAANLDNVWDGVHSI